MKLKGCEEKGSDQQGTKVLIVYQMTTHHYHRKITYEERSRQYTSMLILVLGFV